MVILIILFIYFCHGLSWFYLKIMLLLCSSTKLILQFGNFLLNLSKIYYYTTFMYLELIESFSEVYINFKEF
jgi:hypothetical protein